MRLGKFRQALERIPRHELTHGALVDGNLRPIRLAQTLKVHIGTTI
jgi:hypothetical protein